MSVPRWALLAVTLAAMPVAGLAQAPASWSAAKGRWDDWKAASFANSAAHYAALKAAAKGGTRFSGGQQPDWTGLWTSAATSSRALPRWGYSQARGLTAAPRATVERPALTPAAETALIETLKLGPVALDYVDDCLPAGFPRWWSEPKMREFVVTPDQTWMINEAQSETRRIYTDGRGHIPDAERYALWEGDSIGFWDGDTLVVQTIGLKPGSWGKAQPPYSGAVETIEQIRKDARGMIETRITVYDPGSLQKPWRLIFGSRKVARPPHRLEQDSCVEKNHFGPSQPPGRRETTNNQAFHPATTPVPSPPS